MRILMIFLILMVNTAAFASPVLYGPIQYLSFYDSPFQEIEFEKFYLEDFEDRLFNVPGVTATNNNPGQTLSVLTHSLYGDSVDGDDGVIDGSGVTGYALSDTENKSSENLGFTFTFDADILGSLPTHAGIVWTDGGFYAPTLFEAFGPDGESLGSIGPVHISDNSWTGGTAEDHFFGIYNESGISSFIIRDPGGYNNLGVDHLQYGIAASSASSPVPEPATVLLLGTGLVGFIGFRKKYKL